MVDVLILTASPRTYKLPVTVKSLPIETSFGKPIVTLPVPVPLTSISFAVPEILPTPVNVAVVLPVATSNTIP